MMGATGLVATALSAWTPVQHPAAVLTVGSYHGIAGQFRTIQAAVNAARPGDWVLVGPGDYHESVRLARTAPSSGETGSSCGKPTASASRT